MNTSTASPPTPNLELLHKAVQKFRLNPRRVPFNNLKPFHDSIVELHFDQSQTDLHPLFGRLDTALKAAQGSNELNIANSLWPQEKYPFRGEFLNLLKKDYGATVTPLNYEGQAEQARVTIN